jgi:hypothetical protein
MTTQSGAGGSKQTNQNATHGGININDASHVQVTLDGSGSLPQVSNSSAPATVGGSLGGIILVILALWFLSNALGANDKAIPQNSGRLPSRIPARAVKELVASEMGKCVQASVAEPPTCPQSESDAEGPDAKVTWSLYGSPADGLVIRYKDNTVYVEGVAAMTSSYKSRTSGAPSSVNVYGVQFYGEINWPQTGNPELRVLTATRQAPPVEITKSPPQYNPASVLDAVRATLNTCVAAKTVIQPAGCPVKSDAEVTSYNVKNPRWSLLDDPIRSARISPDPHTGLLHVDGLATMQLHDGDRDAGQMSHPYRADVSIQPDGVRVLAIKFRT